MGLPPAHTARIEWGGTRSNSLQVSVLKDGRLFLGDELVHSDVLKEKLEAELARGAEKKAYISADSNVPYGLVLRTLDAVRAAGIEDVAFITNPYR